MRNQYTSTFEQDYPCRAQIIRCKADRDSAPMNDYRYPEESGSFTGTLTFRCWHRSKPMLLCFLMRMTAARSSCPSGGRVGV